MAFKKLHRILLLKANDTKKNPVIKNESTQHPDFLLQNQHLVLSWQWLDWPPRLAHESPDNSFSEVTWPSKKEHTQGSIQAYNESLHKFHKIHAIHNITAFESKHLGMPCAPRSKPSVPLLGTLPFPAVRASRNSSRWSLEGWCSSISNEKLYQIHTKFVLFLIKCGVWDFSGGVHYQYSLTIFMSQCLMGMPTSSNSNHNECLTVGLWVWIVAAYTVTPTLMIYNLYILRFQKFLCLKQGILLKVQDIRRSLTSWGW